MKAAEIEDPNDIDRVRALGVIDLPTIQKKANLHYALSLDLFGSEVSTNAANAFNSGIKGRYHESRIDDDHRLVDDTYSVIRLVDGVPKLVEMPALTALNMRLRDDYINDCTRGIARWNRIPAKIGIDFEMTLPHQAFFRQIGEFANVHVSPEGVVVDDGIWSARKGDWLPSPDDGAFIASLMHAEIDPGNYAGWIAPPRQGIDNLPGDFQYVKIAA
jgi:benzoyl-CoA 2,3-dioxygenase component B